MKNLAAIFIFLFIINLLHCSKNNNVLLGPGILLTVDKPPDTWYHLKDFLKENHVKLTFYIESYQLLNDSSKRIMKEMIADGHEIAHHTTTHPHSDEYVKQFGMDAYLKNEIISMKDSMLKDGFNPLTFAYPFGDCTAAIDKELLKRFYSLRKVLGVYMNKKLADMDLIYFRYGNIKLFYGIGIDARYHHNVNEVFEALEKAKNSRQTVSLYCHFLSTPDGPFESSNSHIMESDLKDIVLKANSLGLRFYTASEVSRNHF